MKNMVLLIDVNVLLNYLLRREPGLKPAHKIIELCRNGEIHGYMAFHSVSIIWYTLRKTDIKSRRQQIFELCKFVKVTGASHSEVLAAIQNESFADFEDCLQEKCAENIGADYIVTENTKDFANSSTPVVTAFEMLNILDKQ